MSRFNRDKKEQRKDHNRVHSIDPERHPVTLICGIHYGDKVVIAADKAVTAVNANGKKIRHDVEVQKVKLFDFGAIAGAGSSDLIERLPDYLRAHKCQDVRNVIGCIELCTKKAAAVLKPYDVSITGWFFSGFHEIDGINRGLVLAIYHPGLEGGPAKAFQVGTIEFMGMADISEQEREKFFDKWRNVFHSSYASSDDADVLPFLRLVMEDAAKTSAEVSSTFSAATSDGYSTTFLQQ